MPNQKWTSSQESCGSTDTGVFNRETEFKTSPPPTIELSKKTKTKKEKKK